MAGKRISLVAVHPRDLIRHGLQSLLESAGIDTVVVADPAQAAGPLRRAPEAVVVLFDRLGDGAGFELARDLRQKYPRCRVVLIGVVEQPTYLARAVAAGVQDYLFESTPTDQIVAVIEAAAEGKPPATNTAYGRMRALLTERKPEAAFQLSPREQQTLRHIAHGLSNEEIARSMAISIETVKEHVQKILRKLKMEDRTQAAVWAIRQQLVT